MNRTTDIFEFTFIDEQLESDFYKKIDTLDIASLFTYDSKSSPIKVTWADARSMVSGGKDYSLFEDVSKTLKSAEDNNNKKFGVSTLKIINESNNMNSLRTKLKKMVELEKRLFAFSSKSHQNMFNIIWYSDEVMTRGV